MSNGKAMRTLQYVSYLDDTGYGVAGKTLLRALLEAGYAVDWRPLARRHGPYSPVEAATIQSGHPELDACYRQPVHTDVVLLHTVPPLWDHPIREARRAGQLVVGYTVWETDRLPASWVQLINQVDAVLVPSHWNKAVFESSGVHIPIGVLPHCSQFKGVPVQPPEPLPVQIPPDAYMFLTVGEWNARKIPFHIIEAFCEAFPGRADVCLVVKTSALDYTQYTRSWRNGFRRRPQRTDVSVRQLLKHKPAYPEVVVHTQHLTHKAMQYLYTRSNAYLSVVRSEGWGMGAYEAAWYGRPVMTTAWGGQLDFLPQADSIYIHYGLMPVSPQEAWPEYEADQRWASPDLDQVVRAMRSMVEHRDETARLGARLGEYTRLHFSDAAIVRDFEAFIGGLKR
jgi:glycosyltransferase involved in cell wall biosynthesis